MHVAMECVAAAGIRQSAQLFTGAFLWFTCIYPSLLFTHISCCYCCPCCVALTNASTIAFFGSAESSSRFTMLRSPFCCSCRSFTSSESLSAASSARRAFTACVAAARASSCRCRLARACSRVATSAKLRFAERLETLLLLMALLGRLSALLLALMLYDTPCEKRHLF